MIIIRIIFTISIFVFVDFFFLFDKNPEISLFLFSSTIFLFNFWIFWIWKTLNIFVFSLNFVLWFDWLMKDFDLIFRHLFIWLVERMVKKKTHLEKLCKFWLIRDVWIWNWLMWEQKKKRENWHENLFTSKLKKKKMNCSNERYSNFPFILGKYSHCIFLGFLLTLG